jgi:CubicO group peptidase (beta-lactamase class C family)
MARRIIGLVGGILDPRTILEEGRGLHPGAQLYVSRGGETVIDFACGEGRAGVAMRTDSVVQWFSSGKPLTAILIAQLHERGELELDAAVARYIPEFAAKGKAAVTLKQVLTHTGGFRSADLIPADAGWEETIRLICDAPLEAGWIPGERAGYSTTSGWFLLAEIIQRITKTAFDLYMKDELLDPLGMMDSWLRLPLAEYRAYGDRLALMHDTAAVKREPAFLQDASGMAQCRPGSSARGPIRELGRFYEMLLNGGTFNGHRFLTPETIQRFTSRQRVGLFDETFQHKLDFGYGFIINSNRYGAKTVPYGYGMHSGDSAFGHSGAQSSCAFADPEHELVVAWVCNGTPGERPHQKRHREINDAIYEYLELTKGK